MRCTCFYRIVVQGSWQFKQYLRYFLGLCLEFSPSTLRIRLGGLASCFALLDFFPIFSKNYYSKKIICRYSLLVEFDVLENVLPFLAWLDIRHSLTMS